MSLITIGETKRIMGIDDTYDSQLAMLIPIVSYQVMYSICQNRFVNQKITIKNSTFTFDEDNETIVDSLSQFIVSKFPTGVGDIVVAGSLSNDGLYEVKTITASTITLNMRVMDKKLVDEAEDEFIEIKYVQFPQELKLPTAQWLWYLLSKDNFAGLQSESVLSYSATYVSDIPDNIKRQFNQRRKMKFS